MAIIVFQHSEMCRPGRLGATFRDQAIKLDIRRLDLGDPVPVDFDDVDGVISLGGPQHVDQNHPWMAREIEFIKGAHARALPVIGVCLGCQLMAVALGGKVAKMPPDRGPELGFVDVNILPPGQTDSVLAGVAWKSPQLASHFYEVTDLPPGATLLASSAKCKVQAWKAGLRSYAFQWHPECDRPMADELILDDESELPKAGLDRASWAKQLDEKYEMYARLNNRLAVNLATYLVPRTATVMRV
jgi:GMP synthase-like glutamine amidotransferase